MHKDHKTHSVERLVEVAFGAADLDWKEHVVIDQKFIRPAEVNILIGDASKAKKALGWEPKVTFEQMISMMVESDLERLKTKHKIS